MGLHVIRLREGDVVRYLIVPLRMESSAMHEGLRRIAAELSSSGDTEVSSKVEALCLEHSGIVEIH
jgi:hypothetical protein